MLDDVINTYECLLSCLTQMPGMSLEDAFSEDAIESLKKELKWLQDHRDQKEIFGTY